MTQSFINPLSKFTSDTLTTLPGARLYFFENESSTPKEVFKNKEKTVSWGFYATADSAGNFAPIWFDGIVRAELRNSSGVVQTGWPIDHIGSDVSFDTDVTVNGDLTADNLISLGGVEADSASGFITTDYTLNARNPIWSFGNASAYGISYFAGTTSIGNDDVIGIHFGTATKLGSKFLFYQNGNFLASAISFGNDYLNHFSYGTWTATVTGSGTAGVGTYEERSAKYNKIGNTVCFSVFLYWSAHTGVGDMLINIPFTNGSQRISCSIVPQSGGILTADSVLMAEIPEDSAYIRIRSYEPTTGTFSSASISGTGVLTVSGTFFVD